MLKSRWKWEQLSVEGRLVLLAIAHVLPQYPGRGVLKSGISLITGLSQYDIERISRILQNQGLLSIDGASHMLYLSGDAVTDDLCGRKLAEFQEAEKHLSMRRVTISTPVQPTA